mgnify:FL=1
MKVFVSLRMNGRSDAEIIEDQKKALKILENDLKERGELDSPLELIDTVHHTFIPNNPQRLHYLGASIQKLADADFVFFYDDWYKAKGCWVELLAASLYKKKAVYDYPDSFIGGFTHSVITEISYFIEQANRKEEEKKND